MRILLLCLLIISCAYDEYDCPTEVAYEQNIKEIILEDTNISEECKEVISKISYSSLLEMQTSLQNYKKFSYVELFDVLSTVMIFVEGITLNNKK